MAKKDKKRIISLQCTECKELNYSTTKNPTNTPAKLELQKFCPRCRKSTTHKETK